MRKLPLFLLLASAAVPALAAPGGHDRGDRHSRNPQSEQSDDRSQRSEGQRERTPDQSRSQPEQSRSQPEQRRQVDVQRARTVETRGSERQQRLERRLGHQQEQRVQQVQQQRVQQAQQQQRRFQGQSPQSQRAERTREWRQRDGTTNSQSSWQPRERRVRTIPNTNVVRGPSRAERQAYERRDRRDYRDGHYTRWSNNWRTDRRYDWSNYRNHNRSVFRIGIYNDPFGWNYRRWSIGSMLYPSYYGSNYWLNDPWQYRLPPAYGPYRWVRYWDDALLVNIYTGQVMDVLHNFFW